MVFPILGANTESAEFDVSNSLRFNSADSPKLQETTGSNSNRQRFTFSAWVKKFGDMGEDQTLFSANDGGHQPHIKFDNEFEQLNVRISDSAGYNVMTNRVFRDPSAWYHIVVAMDTTQSTASNRIKIYVNGVQETSLRTTNYPTQNYNSAINTNTEHTVGRDISTNNKPFEGYMAEVYFVDGSQLDPTYFGKFNNNGVWIPVELNKGAGGTITFGTHGFYFQFKQTGTGTNSSGIGADTSGNDNHLAPSNLAALDVTTDTPTNNFCVLNSISYPSGLVTNLTEGMLNLLTTDSPYGAVPATFALTSGKWYWEIKVNASSDYDRIGLVGTEVPITTSFDFGDTNLGGGTKTNLAYKSNDGKTRKDGTDQNYGNSYTSGDIIGVAYNADDGDIYFYKNGTIQNSGTAAYTNLDGLTLLPAVGDGVANASGQYFCNFGNPTFSISSGNSDANGYGNFEYSVPSGYYSLCTKNLAEYG